VSQDYHSTGVSAPAIRVGSIAWPTARAIIVCEDFFFYFTRNAD